MSRVLSLGKPPFSKQYPQQGRHKGRDQGQVIGAIGSLPYFFEPQVRGG